jgi:drug/metabolite transporter (DMT)-like permease
MPVADAVIIYFALPMIVAVLSGIVLAEAMNFARWAAAIVGFLGVALTVGPSSALFQWTSLLPMVATVFYAFAHMLTRKVNRKTPPMIIAFYAALSFIGYALVLSLIFGSGTFENAANPSLAFLTRGWAMPGFEDGLKILVVGAFTSTGFFCYAEAYRMAPPSFVAPFEYSAIVWAIALGYLFFGDLPSQLTLIGSVIIIGSGLYLGWQERRQVGADPVAGAARKAV